MITAIIVYSHSLASRIADCVQPDNTPEIHIKSTQEKVLAVIQTKGVRTMVASCDDLFVNLEVARDTLTDS
jgi:hypothetical protein